MNLAGASKRLSKFVNHPDNCKRFDSHQPYPWNFNPSSTLHFGGPWEAAVKSAKTLLVRITGTQNLILRKLCETVLCRIQAVLNSRPSLSMSSLPLNFECLIPSYFLIGRPLIAVPEYHKYFGADGQLNTYAHFKLKMNGPSTHPT